MKKYFVGLCWNEEYKPYFHLKDYESGLDEFIDIPQELLIERINQKICVGTINPYTREYVSCNNTVEDSSSNVIIVNICLIFINVLDVMEKIVM